jgi:hypothetical protein
MIMATDFAPGGANKIPCAKEAADYTVPPRGGKAVFGLRLTFHARLKRDYRGTETAAFASGSFWLKPFAVGFDGD